MTGSIRIVAGVETDPAKSRDAIGPLAFRLRAHVLASGLRMVSLTSGRGRESRTRLLEIADPAGRHWFIRVSNHFRPRDARSAAPHLDLVTRDGVSGFDKACAHVTRIATGQVTWSNHAPPPTRKRR